MAKDTHSADAEFSQASSNMPADESAGTPIYEIGYHLIPTLDESGVVAAVEALKKTLGSAEIIKEQAPAKIPFAYVIERRGQGKREKYAEGYFGFIKFATAKENIAAIEQYLRATHEVLRHLLIETVREDATLILRRAVFSSDRLEGETLKKPMAAAEKGGEVSEAELDKSIDAIIV